MGDGGLAQIQGLGEITYARLTTVAGLDDRKQSQTVRIRECFEYPGRLLSFDSIEHRPIAGLAANLLGCWLHR